MKESLKNIICVFAQIGYVRFLSENTIELTVDTEVAGDDEILFAFVCDKLKVNGFSYKENNAISVGDYDYFLNAETEGENINIFILLA